MKKYDPDTIHGAVCVVRNALTVDGAADASGCGMVPSDRMKESVTNASRYQSRPTVSNSEHGNLRDAVETGAAFIALRHVVKSAPAGTPPYTKANAGSVRILPPVSTTHGGLSSPFTAVPGGGVTGHRASSPTLGAA